MVEERPGLRCAGRLKSAGWKAGCVCLATVGDLHGRCARGGSDDSGGSHGEVAFRRAFFGIDGEGWLSIRYEICAGDCDETLVIESCDGIAQPGSPLPRNRGDEFVIKVNLDGASEKVPVVGQTHKEVRRVRR